MGNIYIGNSSGTASKITSAYVGVDGIARKIKQVYVGDSNNIARLVWRSGGNYLFCKYGSTDQSHTREIFSVFDRTNNTTFTPVTTTSKVYTSSPERVEFARDDARTVVYRNTSTYDFYRRSGDSYSLSFTIPINSTDIKNYVPNSGDTAYIHSSTYTLFSDDLFGLSSDGKYFYTNIVGRESPSGSMYKYYYTSAIIIFDISTNTPVFKQAIKIDDYSTNYGTLYIGSGNASDDLSVFGFTYGMYDGTSSTTYSSNVLIGSINSTYTKGSLNGSVTSGESFAIYSTRRDNIKVSPDGNYVSFCLSVYNPNNYVYYNQKNGYAKIDKTNKTVSNLITLGEPYVDVYTSNVKNWDFVGSNYLYYLVPTSAYEEDGHLVLYVYKKDSNGDFQKTTNMDVYIPISSSELFYNYSSNNTYKKLNSIAFDFENNIAVFFDGRGMYDICELNGSNGAFTGYTRIGGGSFDGSYNVEEAFIG